MKQKNIFVEILTYVGLILWAAAFFFGLNYVVKGAIMVSIPVSVFLLLVMTVLVWAMKKFGNGKADNAMTARNTHILALVLYVVVSLGTAIFICHFVKVTLVDQKDIQQKATQQMQELGRIFSEDCIAGSYMQWVADETDNLRIKLEGEGLAESTIKVRMSDLENELLEGSGFNELKNEVNEFLAHCDYSVSNWVWLTVPNYLSNLQQNKPEYEAKVVECSKQSAYTAESPYDCRSQYQYPDMARALQQVSTADIGLWSVLLIVIIQIFILLSYLAGRPDRGQDPTRYKGEWGRSWSDKPTSRTPKADGGGDDYVA